MKMIDRTLIRRKKGLKLKACQTCQPTRRFGLMDLTVL